MYRLLEKMVEWNPIIAGIVIGILVTGVPLLILILFW